MTKLIDFERPIRFRHSPAEHTFELLATDMPGEYPLLLRWKLKCQSDAEWNLLWVNRFGVEAPADNRWVASSFIENVPESLTGKAQRKS